jgi:flagellar biosynthetic protein FliP
LGPDQRSSASALLKGRNRPQGGDGLSDQSRSKVYVFSDKEKRLGPHAEPCKQPKPKSSKEVPTRVLIPAFIISELKTAFQIGFMFYIPFLVIDMIVASVLLAMGMLMLPPVIISLPFKLMLFVLVDGWNIVADTLIRSFGP